MMKVEEMAEEGEEDGLNLEIINIICQKKNIFVKGRPFMVASPEVEVNKETNSKAETLPETVELLQEVVVIQGILLITTASLQGAGEEVEVAVAVANLGCKIHWAIIHLLPLKNNFSRHKICRWHLYHQLQSPNWRMIFNRV
jgi:hypothetical protein